METESILDHRGRPTALGGIGIVLASVFVSLAGSSLVAETMRIRWAAGTYYGPAVVASGWVLIGFPVLVAVLYGGLRVARARLDPTAERTDTIVFELVTLGTLLSLVLGQILLIGLNLLS
jgi:hypothetical protein